MQSIFERCPEVLEGFVVVVDGLLQVGVLRQIEGTLVKAHEEIGGSRAAVAQLGEGVGTAFLFLAEGVDFQDVGLHFGRQDDKFIFVQTVNQVTRRDGGG